MLKNKYKDDYKQSVGIDIHGKVVTNYVYIGDYHVLPLDEKGKKRTNLVNLAFGFLFTALLVVAGVLNPSSSRTVWVVYPYLFLFLPTAYFLIGAISYIFAPIRMSNADYNGSVTRMHHSGLGIIILSGINVVLDIIYMVVNWDKVPMTMEFVYCGFLVMLCIAGVFYGRTYDKMFAGTVIEKAQ